MISDQTDSTQEKNHHTDSRSHASIQCREPRLVFEVHRLPVEPRKAEREALSSALFEK